MASAIQLGNQTSQPTNVVPGSSDGFLSVLSELINVPGATVLATGDCKGKQTAEPLRVAVAKDNAAPVKAQPDEQASVEDNPEKIERKHGLTGAPVGALLCPVVNANVGQSQMSDLGDATKINGSRPAGTSMTPATEAFVSAGVPTMARENSNTADGSALSGPALATEECVETADPKDSPNGARGTAVSNVAARSHFDGDSGHAAVAECSNSACANTPQRVRSAADQFQEYDRQREVPPSDTSVPFAGAPHGNGATEQHYGITSAEVRNAISAARIQSRADDRTEYPPSQGATVTFQGRSEIVGHPTQFATAPEKIFATPAPSLGAHRRTHEHAEVSPQTNEPSANCEWTAWRNESAHQSPEEIGSSTKLHANLTDLKASESSTASRDATSNAPESNASGQVVGAKNTLPVKQGEISQSPNVSPIEVDTDSQRLFRESRKSGESTSREGQVHEYFFGQEVRANVPDTKTSQPTGMHNKTDSTPPPHDAQAVQSELRAERQERIGAIAREMSMLRMDCSEKHLNLHIPEIGHLEVRTAAGDLHAALCVNDTDLHHALTSNLSSLHEALEQRQVSSAHVAIGKFDSTTSGDSRHQGSGGQPWQHRQQTAPDQVSTDEPETNEEGHIHTRVGLSVHA